MSGNLPPVTPPMHDDPGLVPAPVTGARLSVANVVPVEGVYPPALELEPPGAPMTSYEDTVAEASKAVAASGRGPGEG